MNKKLSTLLMVLALIVLTTQVFAQQILDPANYLTVDNLNDNNTGTTGTVLCDDSTYCEVPQTINAGSNFYGWWSNIGATWFNNSHRRVSRYGSGSATGASATYYFNIPVSDYYLVYHYMGFTGNATSNAYVTFQRFGEGVVADSFRYDIQSNNVITGATGSWKPLGIINVPAATKGLEVKIGADTLTPVVVRVDACRILRSSSTGADLEFGKRHMTGFDTTRMIEDFPATTFKWGIYSDRDFPIYNLGSAALVISDVTFSTTRFSCVTTLPLTVQPGKVSSLKIRFSPKGEESTGDTVVIHSNDLAEPQAILPVIGEGINYNFIMNASSGFEPHWNAPLPTSYAETGLSSWLSSAKSNFIYPIPNGNLNSRVYTASTDLPTATYGFQIPDTIPGKYILEYSGPSGSPNAARNATISVVTPFMADTQKVLNFNERGVTGAIIWLKISDDNTRIFQLNGGAPTTVMFENPLQMAGVGDLLRVDLLRVRLLPIAPSASTSADAAGRIQSFGSVSIFDSVRKAEFNYQRGLQIRSNGETPLKVDSIMIFGADSSKYSIVNLPTLPLTLPAVDGIYNLTLEFLPDSIRLHSATLRMWTNDTVNNRYINITLSGQGVGTNIVVDNSDPTTYISTPVVDWNQAAPTNLNYWQRISGSGTNNERIFTYIYGKIYNGTPTEPLNTIQWFPSFPKRQGGPAVEPDSFDVWAILPTGSSTGNPVAIYEVNHVGGVSVVVRNQNSYLYGGNVQANGRLYLGRYTFLRGGQDIYGSGTIYGNIMLVNDHNLVTEFYRDSVVNRARVDSFVTRADAIILQQAAGPVTSVGDDGSLPSSYSLSQNYPNPFNPTTQIRFGIPQDSRVTLKVYDVLGREVRKLMNDDLRAGYHTLEWDGRNNFGGKVSSGMYIYRLVAGKFVKTLKMMMLK
ncbi:MAG: T9SS type A sorting domain-containing protein [Bacteroidetes bacterium]|nr:T9SS type A sorting domain-containing protein [Bacteroidota bacterium]